MNVVKYNPFRELRGLQDEINRIFYERRTRVDDREDLLRGAWSPRSIFLKTRTDCA